MADQKVKRRTPKLKANVPQGAGWSWKPPGPTGDVPALPVGKFKDIEGQLTIPMSASDDQETGTT